MFRLDVGELEALVDQIPEPLTRAREGMQQFSPDSEQIAKYSELYIRVLMGGENRAKREFNDKDSHASDPATKAFKILSPEKRTELGQQYLQWRLDFMSEETSEGALRQAASLAKEIGLETQVSVIAKPHVHSRFTSLEDASGKTDETAINLATVAKTLGLVDKTREIATNYFQRRLERIQNPNSTDDFEMTNLFAFADVYGLSKDGELTDLYLATSFFADRWGSAYDKMPKITEENEREVMQKGWRIAQNLWQNSSNVKGLAKLIRNEKFKAEYSSNKTARAIAKNVVAETLKGSYGIDEVKSLVDAYKLSGLKKIIGEGISANLQEGHYQTAQQIAEGFGYNITDGMYVKARAVLEEKVSGAVKDRKLEEAIEARLRLKAFDRYRAEGINIESLPEVDLPERYSGKIILVEFQGRTFLRSGSDMHEGICDAFRKEVKLMGFSRGYVQEKGGAHIGFNKDSGDRVIYDKSEQYGECDKEVARQLVQKTFPDQKIVAKPVRNSGW
ncbi:hypothetical protein HYU21_01070 [Candidatus Woesearchaeota archaeon]|nr:hypothetical protein [Candidatus Woesearchaeota archaeon]